MSFIYENDRLLAELIKSAIDHEVKFNKHGQMAADPSVNNELRNYLTVSQKLAEQLKNTYFPPAADTGVVSTGTNKEAALGVPDLASLGNFLDFIVNNQILVDGKRVAYNGSETSIDTTEYLPVTAEQVKFMVETQNPQGERGQLQAEYYVSRALLEKYITSILKDTSKQDERAQQFIKVMLSARLQEINRIFRTKLTTEYKEPEKVLPDTAVVDNLPKDLSPEQPYGTGNVPLTIKDLKDSMSLNSWLKTNTITLKAKNNSYLTINHEDFDHCTLLKILVNRAKYNSNRATDQNAKQYATAYDQRVRAIATEIQCDLGGQQQPNQKPGQTGQGGGLAAATPAILNQLSSLRPFNSQFISFQEISNFLELYEPFANDASVAQMINKLQDSIQRFRSDTQMGSDTIQLYNLTTNQFQGMLKDPSKAYMAASDLHDIVFYGGTLYQRLVTSLQTFANDPVRGKYIDYRAMQQQVTPGGPQLTNVNQINRLMYNLKQEWNQK